MGGRGILCVVRNKGSVPVCSLGQVLPVFIKPPAPTQVVSPS